MSFVTNDLLNIAEYFKINLINKSKENICEQLYNYMKNNNLIH